jgi:hypothetical protein
MKMIILLIILPYAKPFKLATSPQAYAQVMQLSLCLSSIMQDTALF